MSLGVMAVDYEERVDFGRLRKQRLERAREQIKRDKLGALLCFDGDNIRYITSTQPPMWSRGKGARYCILPRDGEPILFEMGTQVFARRESHGARWLQDRILTAPNWGDPRATETCVSQVKGVLSDHGVAGEPLGIDVLDVPLMNAFRTAKIDLADGHASMLQAKLIKTEDEIELLKLSAMMVDAGFDRVARAIRPGVRENDLVALMMQVLYTMGAEEVVNVEPTSGPRTLPQHHDFSDRALRPNDLVFIDVVNSFNGYKTCYYRTFACGRPTQEQKDLYNDCYTRIQDVISVVRPGITTADIARRFRSAKELGYNTEQEAYPSEVGHGIGISHWELPFISRAYSFDYPYPLQEGMVLALETYSPSKTGKYAVRIEDEVVVTSTGHEVITKYPADELVACGI